MNKKCSYIVKIGLFTAFLIAIDQISKFLATVCLKGKNDFVIIKDVFCFHYLDGGNTGAAWGMFSGRRFLFITKTSVYKILNIFLILLLSGAVGNLIDRVFHGFVIDFIYFELIHFPIFNVADCYVTVSCIGIIFICLFRIKEEDFNKIISIRGKL